MKRQVKTCFTINFTSEQYNHAREYVEDMKRHPRRIYWNGKGNKKDEDLIMEQIAHRILSGFYNNDPLLAGQHIVGIESQPAS